MTTLEDRHGAALRVERDAVVANLAHTNLYWSFQTAPGRTAGTVETAAVDFG